MFGKPIEGSDFMALILLAVAIPVILIARFATLVKLRPGMTPPPTPETLARVSRNVRTNMTLMGVALGLEGIGFLLSGRVPEWARWTVLGLQLAATAAILLHLILNRRQRRLSA
jgi:hypothetical protein